MADVSKFKLGATTYNIKDANALHLSGGTLTGALNFANNVYNTVGDDVQIGDANQAGKLAIKGKNGNTGIYFAPYSGSTAQTITINGSGQMDISGTLNVATAIKQNGTAVSLTGHTHSFTPAGTIAVQTAGTTTSITPVTSKTVVTGVTKKTVVTGGSTTNIPNISVSSKSIPNVTAAGTASYSNGVLTITNTTLGTAISVGSASAGTAIAAYTSLTTGDSVTVTTGASVTAGTAVTVKTGDAAYKFTGTAGTTGAASA